MSGPRPGSPAATGQRWSRLPWPALVTLLVGLACGLAAASRLGRPGLVSALLAAGVVVLFFWSGRVPLIAAGSTGRAAALLVLLTNYALRVLLAAVALRLAARAGVVVPRVVGGTVVACALAWTTALVVLLLRREDAH
ncbi:MAG: hypothetical protein M3P46_00160 [Actinomycetota bacterium]|nr:hypothetical protein [Actinomycetota bacterium]